MFYKTSGNKSGEKGEIYSVSHQFYCAATAACSGLAQRFKGSFQTVGNCIDTEGQSDNHVILELHPE